MPVWRPWGFRRNTPERDRYPHIGHRIASAAYPTTAFSNQTHPSDLLVSCTANSGWTAKPQGDFVRIHYGAGGSRRPCPPRRLRRSLVNIESVADPAWPRREGISPEAHVTTGPQIERDTWPG